MRDDVPQPALELPEDLIDRHFGVDSGVTDTGFDEDEESAASPEGEGSPDDTEDEDTLETDSEDEGDDTDSEDDGDDDLDDDGEDEEESPDEDTDALPEFDRDKFLKKHPELEPAYKHMQAHFTKKNMEAARVKKEAESYKQEYESFANKLADDNGMSEFLVQVALHRPEIFDKAYEEAVSLNDDEDKKSTYLKDRELSEREQKLQRQEEDRLRQAQEARIMEVVDLTRSVAKKYSLTGPEIEVAEQFVANRIHENRAAGNADISDKEVREAVKLAADRLQANRDKVRKETERTMKREGLSKAKKKATQSKRPAPPRAGGAPARRDAAPTLSHPNEDPLDAIIDARFG
jgi:hypothetical protein